MEEYLKNPFYQANYCEENIWLLSDYYYKLGGKNGFVCFITNKSKQIPLWYQKKCLSKEEPVIWDYHVIFLCPSQNDELLVYDFDTTMELPVNWIEYATNAFQPELGIKEQYRQCFRVVPVEIILQYFASDRSHMYSTEDNKWLSEPPSWPIICGPLASTSHNLMEYLNCDNSLVNDNDNDGRYGVLYNLEEFLVWCNELDLKTRVANNHDNENDNHDDENKYKNEEV